MSSFSLAVGLILSTRSLQSLGNKMGEAGFLFPVAILLGAGIHLLTVFSSRQVFASSSGFRNEMEYTRKALGVEASALLFFCSRGLFLVAAAPILLATAGYAFNEIFLYWFPNLGFSFCLLGFLLMLHLLGPRAVRGAQIAFVLVAFSGLLVLSLIGIAAPEKELGMPNPFFRETDMVPLLLAALILFAGFELPAVANEGLQGTRRGPSRAMILAILSSGAIFCLWGAASWRSVPLERLAETTVPHMVAAGIVMGDCGKIIMASVVLASSCGAVNALFIAVAAGISEMAAHGVFPSFLRRMGNRPLIPILLLTGATAFMMGAGMAGEPVLGIFIRAALFFWFLHYAALHLSALRLQRGSFSISSILGISSLSAAAFGMVWYDPEREVLLRVIFFILLLAAFLGLMGMIRWRRLRRK